jgi:hypothetical protein
MKRGHTLADVNRALQAFRRAAQRTPREQADDRMQRAKDWMTAAAQAALAGDTEAADLGDRARHELEAARLNLQRIDAEEAQC